MGGGLGLGMSSYTFEAVGLTSDRGSRFAFMTDFKIGYAPTNQVEIVYSNKAAWFNDKIFFGGNVTFLNNISTAAVNYYFKPEGPTPFISGGLGLASLSEPFEDNSGINDIGNWAGFGFYVGGGYEFAKHFAVTLDLMYGLPQINDSGIDFTFNGFVPRVSVIATAF